MLVCSALCAIMTLCINDAIPLNIQPVSLKGPWVPYSSAREHSVHCTYPHFVTTLSQQKLSLEVKWLGCKVNQSPPSSMKV